MVFYLSTASRLRRSTIAGSLPNKCRRERSSGEHSREDHDFRSEPFKQVSRVHIANNPYKWAIQAGGFGSG